LDVENVADALEHNLANSALVQHWKQRSKLSV
jgi:hypothetical protein